MEPQSDKLDIAVNCDACFLHGGTAIAFEDHQTIISALHSLMHGFVLSFSFFSFYGSGAVL
jgi:hypothetical protein